MNMDQIMTWLDGLGAEKALILAALIWAWREIRRLHSDQLAEKDRHIQFIKNELSQWKTSVSPRHGHLRRQNEKSS